MNLKGPDLRRADLQILDVKPDDPKEKGRDRFLVTLRNNGPDRIGATKLLVELEVFGKIIGSSDKRIDRMNAGEDEETRVEIPKTVIIPSTNGTLYLRWFSSEVEDLEVSNNVYKLPVQLPLRMPDLVPVKPTIDRNGVLSFSVQNQGNARAEASVTALYINGALVERYNTAELAPRGKRQFRYKATEVSTEDKVVIVADFNADVEEESEENNRSNP
jgi:hypothetical protein